MVEGEYLAFFAAFLSLPMVLSPLCLHTFFLAKVTFSMYRIMMINIIYPGLYFLLVCLKIFSEINKYLYYLFSDKVTFRQIPERRKGGTHGGTWEKSIP